MWKEYYIKYCNPNAHAYELKKLYQTGELYIMKARTDAEAEKKARRRLMSTGMWFSVHLRNEEI